jgi:hypothetical protein
MVVTEFELQFVRAAGKVLTMSRIGGIPIVAARLANLLPRPRFILLGVEPLVSLKPRLTALRIRKDK